MTLMSGTLADLDLASIGSVTSLGRSSLRLELRESSGQLIGSLVLKAGRVVSASAGGKHGRDALRILLRSSSDTRFELAREPLDFVLSSAVASVDDLAVLRGDRSRARAARPTRSPDAGGHRLRDELPTVPTPIARVPMMQGQIVDLDLLALLQTVGIARQLLQIELLDRAGAFVGSITVKAGKIVAAEAGASEGLPAVSELLSSPRCAQFAVYRIPRRIPRDIPRSAHDDPGELRELTSISQIGVRFAKGTGEMYDRTVLEGSLADFDVPTLLRTISTSRQHCALEIRDDSGVHGRIFIKSGQVLGATAGNLNGVAALHHLIGSSPTAKFRVLRLGADTSDAAPLGAIPQLLLGHETTVRSTRGRSASLVSPPRPDPLPAAPDGHAPAAPEPVLMAGDFSDVDLRTLLEVLGATRQHARLELIDIGDLAIGEVAIKAGWVLSAKAGALQGREALAFLFTASRQLRFRVLTGVLDAQSVAPLASVGDLLGELAGTPRERSETPTRILRWAIPLSFALGGTIVFFAARPAAAPPAPAAPTIAAQVATAEPTPAPPPAEPSAATSAVASAPAAPPPTLDIEATPELAAAGRPTLGMSVRTAQAALKRLGYNPGPIDNVYGRLTRIAVIQLQRAQHLPATGVLDRETWSAIVAQLIP